MRRKRFLHTDFVKFLVEKYKDELQDNQEETQEELEEIKPQVQVQAQKEQEDETQNDVEDDFDKLVREYNDLQKKYKLKYDRVYNKRK